MLKDSELLSTTGQRRGGEKMPPEDIPEDREESYPCPDEECQGSLTSNGKHWTCSECSLWFVDQKYSDEI
jgi:hypothetical protein